MARLWDTEPELIPFASPDELETIKNGLFVVHTPMVEGLKRRLGRWRAQLPKPTREQMLQVTHEENRMHARLNGGNQQFWDGLEADWRRKQKPDFEPIWSDDSWQNDIRTWLEAERREGRLYKDRSEAQSAYTLANPTKAKQPVPEETPATGVPTKPPILREPTVEELRPHMLPNERAAYDNPATQPSDKSRIRQAARRRWIGVHYAPPKPEPKPEPYRSGKPMDGIVPALRADSQKHFEREEPSGGVRVPSQRRSPTPEEERHDHLLKFMPPQLRAEYEKADPKLKAALWETNERNFEAAQERDVQKLRQYQAKTEKALDMLHRIREDPSKANLLPPDEATMDDLHKWHDEMSKPVRRPFGNANGGEGVSSPPLFPERLKPKQKTPTRDDDKPSEPPKIANQSSEPDWHKRPDLILAAILFCLGSALAIGLVLLPPGSPGARLFWLFVMFCLLAACELLFAHFLGVTPRRAVFGLLISLILVALFGWGIWPAQTEGQSDKRPTEQPSPSQPVGRDTTTPLPASLQEANAETRTVFNRILTGLRDALRDYQKNGTYVVIPDAPTDLFTPDALKYSGGVTFSQHAAWSIFIETEPSHATEPTLSIVFMNGDGHTVGGSEIGRVRFHYELNTKSVSLICTGVGQHAMGLTEKRIKAGEFKSTFPEIANSLVQYQLDHL